MSKPEETDITGKTVVRALNSSVDGSRTSSESKSVLPIAAEALTLEHLESEACRYDVYGEIARGGMGAILKGCDPILNREVAIKVLFDKSAKKKRVVRRFLEEAQINGQLQHPGIVPVYEVGKLNDNRPFFAMKLVKGKTLSQLLKKRTSKEDDRSRFVGIFEQVCQTMAYVHSRNVIHRDLKPSNIMVGAFGEVQVMDWGIAKVLGESDERESSSNVNPQHSVTEIRTLRTDAASPTDTMTLDGMIVGTAAYMPPEQALGELGRVNEKADVFGLGAILCEILTGEPPHVGSTKEELYRLAARGRTEDACKRLDECSTDRELVQLAKDCLAYDPEIRPANAGVVANRIANYFESVDKRLHQAELDRTKAFEEKKRRRVIFALAGTICATLLLTAGSWIWLQNKSAELNRAKLAAADVEIKKQQELAHLEEVAKQKAVRARARESELREIAEAAQQKTELTLCDVYTTRGLAEADGLDSGAAIMWFAAAAELAKNDPVRRENNLIRANNWTQNAPVPVGATTVSDHPTDMEFQPSGELLLVNSELLTYNPLEYQAPSKALKNQTSDDFKWLEDLELPSPPGLEHPKMFNIFDWRNNRNVTWEGKSEIEGVAVWSPDGTKIAIGRPNGNVEIREINDGNLVSLAKHPGKIQSLAYSDDGKQLAIASTCVQILRTDTDELDKVQRLHPSGVHSMRFSPDGAMLVTATHASIARVFSTENGSLEPVLVLPHFNRYLHLTVDCKTAPVWSAGSSGELLLTTFCDYDELAVWNVDDRSFIERIKLDRAPIAEFKTDGNAMMAVCSGNRIEIRNSKDDNDSTIVVDHAKFVSTIKFGKGAKTLFTGSLDSTARLWSTADGNSIGPMLMHNSGVASVAISQDERWLATATGRGLVRIWRNPEKRRTELIADCSYNQSPELSLNGRFMLARKAKDNHTNFKMNLDSLPVFDTMTGKKFGSDIVVDGEITDATFSFDSSSVFVGHQKDGKGFLAEFDLSNDSGNEHELRAVVALTGIPVWVEANPVLPIAAVMCTDNKLNLIDIETGKTLYTRQYDSRNNWHSYLEFTADGKKLVVCNETYFELLNVTSGVPYYDRVSYPHSNFENCATAVSPDGKVLAIASTGSARFWDLETGLETGKPLIHMQTSSYLGAVFQIRFSSDSRHVLTASLDKHARLWDWRTGELVCPAMKHDDEVFCAEFTPDDKFAITGSRGLNSGPHVWDLRTGMRMAPQWDVGHVHPDQEVKTVALSNDENSLFIATTSYELGKGKKSLIKLDFSGLLRLPDSTIEKFKTLGELTSSKTITLGAIDSLPVNGWLSTWNSFLTQNPRICGALDEKAKTR